MIRRCADAFGPSQRLVENIIERLLCLTGHSMPFPEMSFCVALTGTVNAVNVVQF